MSESRTSVRRVDAADKRRQALLLRKAGATFADIARQLGYSGPPGAFKAVETALRETLQEPADDLRRLERERLDALFLRLWPLVMTNPGTPPDLQAVDRLLKVMSRRAKLEGLDLADESQNPQVAELIIRVLGPGLSMSDLCGGRVLNARNAIPEG